MAKNMQPIVKRCRALDISPAVMGYTKKSKTGSTKRNPDGQRRHKKSEYANQLNEKQKVKFVYGILEKQFRMYYEKAAKTRGITGEILLTTIERRLDNVIFRLGLARTRREARQLVTHGFFSVNGKAVNIPSYLVSAGNVIAVREKYRSNDALKVILSETSGRLLPQWLTFDAEALEGKVTCLPKREDIDFPVQEHLIVELYSK
ncbi:MAG: 30S ribosomal protein S4 [Clostridia bacterium]|nr:30S ribosomal protein S4 [Clostridia bacterium]